MNHLLRCRCGAIQGLVNHPETASRGVCYCKDCQAFAHSLGKAGDVLDEMGGTDVIAIQPRNLSFTQGLDRLACLSLSEKGMLRWYASCCNTPIGYTPRNYKLAHVGLVHTCLHAPSTRLDDSFGPVRMRVNTQSAKGSPERMPLSTFVSILRFVRSLAAARLSGAYRRTPFFDPQRGTPIVAPKVLTFGEREQLMKSF